MSNIIQHKRNSTPGTVPGTGALSQGEIGINIGDGKFYTKNSSNNIINLGVSSISGTTITPASGLFSGDIVANTGTLNRLIFNTLLNDPDLSAGQLQWNSTEGTLDLGLDDNYTMHLGEELLYRVRNVTGSTLLAGSPVYASGLSPGANNRIEVGLYAADGNIREIRFMGLISEDLPNNGTNGYATQFGYIRGIDTRGDAAVNGTTNKLWTTGEPAWSQGDILYVHPSVPGKLTKIEPKHSISVAIITNAASNGKIFVRPTSYGHLDDNHDVNVSGVVNGQFLQYNSVTDYWVPSSSGNFSALLINGTGVSVSGHTHTTSDITNFNSSVSGLLPTNLITGTGTTNYISKWTGSTSQGNSIIFDNGTNVGIGTASPAAPLHIFNPTTSSALTEVARFGTSGTYDGNFRLLIGSTSDRGGELRYYEGSTEYSRVNFDVNRIDFITRGNYPINFLTNNNGTEGHNSRMTIGSNGNVGIGTTTPEYKLQVNGSFGATTKSFRIDHPSRPNYTLEYGSLESPYHGVRLTGRGRVVKGSGVVVLPPYLKDLIHDDETINIQITNIKHGKTIYIDTIDLKNDQFTVKADRCKTVGALEFFWTFTGTRKDVDDLVVEREK